MSYLIFSRLSEYRVLKQEHVSTAHLICSICDQYSTCADTLLVEMGMVEDFQQI